jgi:putative restriction endonuclease
MNRWAPAPKVERAVSVTKAIFTTKVEPSYDDLPEKRYHFPRIYLRQVEAAISDWIIYYEPRRSSSNVESRGGRQAYFAIARVQRIDRDPRREDHFYAFVSDYLEFVRPVPFKEGTHYYESSLKRDDGNTNKGAFGRAVRNLSDNEYELILKAGFVGTLFEINAAGDSTGRSGFEEEPAPFERPIVDMVVARPFREAAFAASVKAAYGDTCAFTGLRIINGGGRAEVQAAHIRPVAAGGSDSVRNGLALAGTVHWMFDRGLISMDEDRSILMARNRLPEAITRLFREDGKVRVPRPMEAQPHPAYLRFHREHIFKG